jgi:hypothetical protein
MYGEFQRAGNKFTDEEFLQDSVHNTAQDASSTTDGGTSKRSKLSPILNVNQIAANPLIQTHGSFHSS